MYTIRWTRWFTPAVIAVLLVSGCGSPETAVDDDYVGSEAATALLEELLVVLVEQPGCVDATDALEPWLDEVPDADARVSFEAAASALDEAVVSCDRDTEQWTEAMVRAVEALGQAEFRLGSVHDALVLDDIESGEIVDVAVAATSQYDRLFGLIGGRRRAQQSRFWFSPTELAHVTELRRLVDSGGTPTVALVGDSMLAHGLDVGLLRGEGVDAYLLALAGATPPIQVDVLADARALGADFDHVVWGISTHWLFGGCAIRDDRFEVVTDQRARVFTTPSGTSATAFDLLLGADPARPARDVPSYDSPFPYRGDISYGSIRPLSGEDDGVRADQIESYAPRYQGRPHCESKLELVADTLDRWMADGLAVTLIVPPITDDLTVLHPDGRTAHEQAIADLRQVADAAGAQFFDYSNAVPNDEFHDLAHVNEQGQDRFTEALAADLADPVE